MLEGGKRPRNGCRVHTQCGRHDYADKQADRDSGALFLFSVCVCVFV